MKIQTQCLINLKSLIRVSTFLLTAIFLIIQLSGCATAGKGTLPQGGDMTMAQIYQKETGISMDNYYESSSKEACVTGDQSAKQIRRELRTSEIDYKNHMDYAAYSIPLKRPVKQLFKPLNNPEIPMYIYPHLVQTESGAQPVPGYTTAFFLYRENHFALPSEEY